MLNSEIGVDMSTSTHPLDFDDPEEPDEYDPEEGGHTLEPESENSWKIAEMFSRIIQLRDNCGYPFLDEKTALTDFEHLLYYSSSS